MSLDLPTLFIVATCVTALLGLFLISLWIQDRSTRALGWWAAAYLVGGFAVMLWFLEPRISAIWPSVFTNALLFLACGMIWSGARVFHGGRVLSLAMSTGAIVWLIASQLPEITARGGAKVVISSLIVTTYAVLTSVALNRERRNRDQARIRAVIMPVLHGAVFLSPILTNYLFPDAAREMGDGFFGLFALLTLLYVVGTAFIVVVMANERSAWVHKTAAMTDPLTGLFNRRGFLDAACRLMATSARKGEPVTVLMFDLDRFKSINDRFGHAFGDEVLRAFANTATRNMRAADVIGRLGGEEFAAILPGGVDATASVAHRVRAAFEVAAKHIGGQALGATVSIGAVSTRAEDDEIASLLARADAALYRAKTHGRNRVVVEGEPLEPPSPPLVPQPGSNIEYAAL